MYFTDFFLQKEWYSYENRKVSGKLYSKWKHQKYNQSKHNLDEVNEPTKPQKMSTSKKKRDKTHKSNRPSTDMPATNNDILKDKSTEKLPETSNRDEEDPSHSQPSSSQTTELEVSVIDDRDESQSTEVECGTFDQIVKKPILTQYDPIVENTQETASGTSQTSSKGSIMVEMIREDLQDLLLSQKTLPDIEVQQKWESTYDERFNNCYRSKTIDKIFEEFKYLKSSKLCVSLVSIQFNKIIIIKLQKNIFNRLTKIFVKNFQQNST